MKLSILPGSYSIGRYAATMSLPAVPAAGFLAITRTDEELSIVCEAGELPEGLQQQNGGWRCLKVEGPLDFSLTGILSAIAAPLAEAKVSIFAISTFDTDYVLVQQGQLETAINALRAAKFTIDQRT